MSTTKTQETYRSYGTAKGWRIFIYIFAPLLILLFFSSPLWMFEGEWTGIRIGFIAGAWLFGLFFCYCLYETAKGRHIITEDSLVYQGAFRRKELPLDSIKGYRIDQQYTYVEPRTAANPKIRIGYTSEKYSEIQQWLSSRFPDLDKQEQEQEEGAILDDYNLGHTASVREENLAAARKTAKLVNGVGLATGAWLFLLPNPYFWAITAGLAVPLAGIAALFWHRNIIRPDEQKNSAYPSVAAALFAPTFGLLLRDILDYELLSYTPILPIAGTVAALVGAVVLLGSREFMQQQKLRLSINLSVIAFALLYGYSSTVAINCVFDEGQPVRHKAEVLSKHYSSGKTTTYYLHVSPWGARTEAEDITVSEEYYDRIQPSTTINIYQLPGRLNVPWFTAGN
ncbi:hypothetical protein [Hymenobacter sp. YC55]|uniref:hypothetical protein n=1 Tax=Hymenobacter sp. YC55 TaxID=3034019 RepID=UPI0023FA1548|nr:hypothetical protein [Hymenobacter sp. YC55]MDF7813080.1 hypothetical protein [Hymenobacter sp. YC55]